MPARYVTAIVEAFERYAARPALAFGDLELTFRETGNAVHRVTRALEGMGADRGAGVMCVTANRPEALLIRLAAHVLGARLTQVVVDPSTHGLAHILRDAEPAVVVADVPLPATTGPRIVALDDLMEAADGEPLDLVPVRAREEDMNVIVVEDLRSNQRQPGKPLGEENRSDSSVSEARRICLAERTLFDTPPFAVDRVFARSASGM